MTDNEKDINVDVNASDATEETSEETIETTMERFFYHQRRALEETGKALEALLPPDFRSHAGEASREFAKGFRILIDDAIDELKKVSERDDDDANEVVDDDEDVLDDATDDDDDDNPPTSSTGKTKVRVKVD